MKDFKQIEQKWQKKWEEAKIFESNPDGRKKLFITIPYPYMNGEPHIGSAFTWFRGDAYARFKRMQGFNVLLPQGFHATGEPILGVVERLRMGDPDQISAVKQYGATDKDIENFVKLGPEFVAKFWMQRWKDTLKSAGISIDWRRSFITAITPAYNRFIEWQYKKLREGGYVTQGTHPVVWCPHDQSPTGDHDRLKGEGESPIEYTIVKFKLDSGEILPCATLRPETVYGATNLWVNPSASYVWASINGETWLLSDKAAEKMGDQMHEVKILEKTTGDKILLRKVENPVNGEKISVLPAKFVDPNTGTGLVMSVPAHAPYDWIALKDLQNDYAELAKYSIDKKMLSEIRPVSIIATEGFGNFPAVEISESMLIGSQDDTEKLEKATSEVYKKEFHTGVLKESVAGYAGRKVSDVKDEMISGFKSRGIGDSIWELTGEVVCRCRTPNHVKILQNQWFLKFSDEKWKKLAKSCIAKMRFYPEEARAQFVNTVDWLKDKACARRSGLGTKLPWDKEWIVETLSDSTIYMAYYTLAGIINDNKISEDSLTDSVFDFVLLGEGDADKVAKESGLTKSVLSEMKKEFDYYYPVDIRTSAKDLLQNHLTFYIMHHVAIWDRKRWPKSIAVSGFVNVRGQKMSKRFGNVIVMKDMIRKIGSDLTRVNLISSNENMDDADWKEDSLKSFSDRIEEIMSLAKSLHLCKRTSVNNADNFLLSRLQGVIDSATKNLEEMRLRSAAQDIFFNALNDLEWYVSRCVSVDECNRKTLETFLDSLVRMMSPFTPHYAEEIWSLMGRQGFVATASWPAKDRKLIKPKSEMSEGMVRRVLEDVRQIEKIRSMKAKDVTVIVSADWKFGVYKKMLGMKDMSLKEIFSAIGSKGKDESQYVQNLYKRIREMQAVSLTKKEQLNALNEARGFLERTLGARLNVESEEDSQLEKRKSADVHKPAIYLAQ